MNPTLIFIGFAFLFGIIIISRLFNSGDHSAGSTRNLREDAKIIDVNTKLVGDNRARKYRTTVVFDDGFKYVSHDTDRQNNPMGYNISISESMKLAIVEKAIIAHREAMGLPPTPPQPQPVKPESKSFDSNKIPAWKRVEMEQNQSKE